MKKSISVNIRGIMFNIEEDGYEKLRKYIDDLRSYFASYEDQDEIIDDIENRIAEIFQSRLTKTKEVITLEDVESVIATLGHLSDFEEQEGVEVDEENSSQDNASSGTGSEEKEEQQQKTKNTRRIYRDEKRKVLGGVAAGIANFFGIDPIWVRIIILVLTVGINFSFGFPLSSGTFGFSIGWMVIAYIILWIILPPSNDLKENLNRKLYRDEDDALIGGVASGLAKYIGVDPLWIRLLFVILLFTSSGLIIYLILWAITPVAKTVSEKVQMQGEPLTVENIDKKVKDVFSEPKDEEQSTLKKIVLLPFKILTELIQKLGPVLRNLIGFAVNLLRFSMGFGFIAFALFMLFVMVTILCVSLGLSLDTSWVIGNFPIDFFTNSFSQLGVVAIFFTIMIPCSLIGMLGVNLIGNKNYLKPVIGGSLFGLWVLSIGFLIVAAVQTSINFQKETEVVEEVRLPYNYTSLQMDSKNTLETIYKNIDMNIMSHKDSVILVKVRKSAFGRSKSDAAKNANMISYKYNLKDSTLYFDSNFEFEKDAKFRVQRMEVDIYVPENVKVNYSDSFKRDFKDELRIKLKNAVDMEWDDEDDITIDYDDDDWEETPYTTYDIFNFDVQPFNEVKISDRFKVKIISSDSHFVAFKGDKRLLKEVIFKQSGSKIKIDYDDHKLFNVDDDSDQLEVTIGSDRYDEIELTDALEANIKLIQKQDLKLILAGAVECKAELQSYKLKTVVAGASQLDLEGSGEILDAEVIGASKLNALNYQATNVDIELVGACAGSVYATEKIKADVTGASDLKYRGNPEIESETSGASSIKKLD